MKLLMLPLLLWTSFLMAAAPHVRITDSEATLARLVNEYRQKNGLPAIPLSSSLSRVAQAHAWDTITHKPNVGTSATGQPCNLHSWSNKGSWSPICFTGSEGEFMWNKPRELTVYTDNGFEISAGGNPDFDLTPELALQLWQSSLPHNNVILNRDVWTNPWLAMGVGMYKGHAHLWFGMSQDPAGAPDTGPVVATPVISADKTYRIKNFTLEVVDLCLEGNQYVTGTPWNGASFMDRCVNGMLGQTWILSPAFPGYFKMTNAFLAGQNKCLEGNINTSSVAGGAAFMDNCQTVAGQYWKMVPQGGHGYVQLTTAFVDGQGLCLETNPNGPAIMSRCENLAKQLWMIEEL